MVADAELWSSPESRKSHSLIPIFNYWILECCSFGKFLQLNQTVIVKSLNFHIYNEYYWWGLWKCKFTHLTNAKYCHEPSQLIINLYWVIRYSKEYYIIDLHCINAVLIQWLSATKQQIALGAQEQRSHF